MNCLILFLLYFCVMFRNKLKNYIYKLFMNEFYDYLLNVLFMLFCILKFKI